MFIALLLMGATGQSVLGPVVWTPAPLSVRAGAVVIRTYTPAASVKPEGQSWPRRSTEGGQSFKVTGQEHCEIGSVCVVDGA